MRTPVRCWIVRLLDYAYSDATIVVRAQHKYYIPLSLGLGLVLPTVIGASYGDAMGGYIWGGIVARLMVSSAGWLNPAQS